jgi:hypothetical protein
MFSSGTSVCLCLLSIKNGKLIRRPRHWFYEDFIREENPKFPSLPLKKFSAMLFHACPLLHQWSHDHEQAFNTFMQYKTRVPVCGAIMLNDTWEKVCHICIFLARSPFKDRLCLCSASLSRAGNHLPGGASPKERLMRTNQSLIAPCERCLIILAQCCPPISYSFFNRS